MGFLQSKRGAVLVTALVCVFSVFFGSYKSINNIKEQVQQYFSLETKANRYPLKTDLVERAGYAVNLCDLFNKYALDKIPPQLAEIRNINLLMNSAELTPEAAFELNQRLTAEFETLYDNMLTMNLPLTAQDRANMNEIRAEVKAKLDIISRSDYNSYAAEQNGKINSFPIKLFKTVLGIEDTEAFK